MLFLIEIHWTRRAPDPDQPSTGSTTYAEYASTVTRATSQAARKFQRHYHVHRAITHTCEKQKCAALCP
jgi:hypothetical protein